MKAFLLSISVGVLVALAPAAPASEAQRLSEALGAVAGRNFDKAATLARQLGDPAAADIVEWHRLRAGGASWSDYVRFITRNADWPGMELVYRRAEQVMPPGIPAEQVRAFFSAHGPQTGIGALRLAEAQPAAEAAETRARAWRDQTMSSQERALYLARYKSDIAGSHVARLDNLLWSGDLNAAQEMLPLVPAADAALGRARIALRAGSPGVDALIAAVPRSHAGDPGLAHDRFLWRISKGRWEDAAALLADQSSSAAALGRPEEWANRRRSVARDQMRDGNARAAYRIASQHFLSAGSNYADLEWLSGYLALRYLNDPGRAVTHFTRFRAAVETPISLGRAGYWLGLAYEAAGDTANAAAAFRFGATHQTTFYGQLAAERSGAAVDATPTRRGGLPGWRDRAFARSSVVRAAQLLSAAGDDLTAQRFLLHAQERMGADDSAALARLAIDIGQTRAAVVIGKRLAEKGLIVPEAYYTVTELAGEVRAIPPELAMAIARQESELNPRAVSPAGARGLMQLMPGTAKKMSAKLGLDYSQVRLTADPVYNGQLGSAYLADMLARYDGSLILAAVAYNAGPARADEWIRRFGDPRRRGVDPVDWIEHIPYRETRNYVMRVLESMHVYRLRISGQPQAIGLTDAIRPRG